MKRFNNLFDSVVISVFAVFEVALATMAFIGINTGYVTKNKPLGNAICAVIFGIMIFVTVVLIMKYCYEYWSVSNNRIQSKKPLRKKVVIGISEITKIEKKQVTALIFGMYQSEAYVIYSSHAKITILINKQNEKLLKEQFENECYEEIFVDKTLQLSKSKE